MSVTMTYKCNILLGKIIKVNVHYGTITLKTLINNIPGLDSVFIEINGRPIPFFIAESYLHGADLLSLKLVDYDTADKIKEFKGCKVFLTSGDTEKPHADNYEELNGFGVFDENGLHGADLLSLKLVDYDTADKIKEFKGCRVFLTSGDTEKPHADNYEELNGFNVFDENGNKIGTVNNVIQNPRQWLLSILSVKGKEILLPVHEDLILGVDNAKRVIIVKIPEGLLEIN